jgi:hypothetical protein
VPAALRLIVDDERAGPGSGSTPLARSTATTDIWRDGGAA